MYNTTHQCFKLRMDQLEKLENKIIGLDECKKNNEKFFSPSSKCREISKKNLKKIISCAKKNDSYETKMFKIEKILHYFKKVKHLILHDFHNILHGFHNIDTLNMILKIIGKLKSLNIYFINFNNCVDLKYIDCKCFLFSSDPMHCSTINLFLI